MRKDILSKTLMVHHSWAIDIAIFVAFLLVNMIVGFRYRGKSNSFREYAVGDKKFSTATLTATIVATWMSGSVLFVSLENTYSTGLYYMIAAIIGASAGLLITGYVIGPRMGKFLDNVSVPESLGKLYGSYVQAIAGVSTVLSTVGYIAIQFKVISRIVSIFLHSDSLHSIAGITLNEDWLTIIASSIVVLYAASGGVKSVTFTDVIQFLTFGTLLPVLALVIWHYLKDPGQVAHLLTHNPNFSFQKVVGWSPEFMGTIALICYLMTPGLPPELFQRMAMARDTTQVKRSIGYATIVCLGIDLCIMWIAILLLADQPGLEPSKLVQYMVTTYTYPGLRGFLCIGVIALAMSTADSALNACAVVIANDILPPLKIRKVSSLNTAKWATVFLGFWAMLLALRVENLLYILLGSANFYAPIVVVPMLLAVFGFETSRRVVFMAMGAGAATATSCLLYFKSVNSFFPGMLANFLVMMGAHYLLAEKGGWGNNPIPISYHTEPLSSQWKQWKQEIRQFRLMLYLEKCLPKQDQAYILLAFYIFTTTYASLYLLPKEVSIQYPSLYKGLYYSVTLVTTLFLAFPIWPKGLRAKRLLTWMWPVSIFYTLPLIGNMLVILSGFELPQLMLLMLNLLMTILFLDGPVAIIMFMTGVGAAVCFLKQYTTISLDFPSSIGTLQFRILYGLLLFSSSLIALFKHQQAYRGLEGRNVLLKDTQKATSQALLLALQHREQLAREMRQESTHLFNSIHEISDKLEQETKQLQDEQAITTARETLRKANTKLKAAAVYFDQIIYQVKDYIRLYVSTIPLQKLLQAALKDLKRKQDPPCNTQIIVQQYTQQQEVQCDVGAMQQLLVDGIAYAQQHAQDKQPILLSIADTTLGYPITAVKGYTKKVEALCITITTQNTPPLPRDLYMGAVSNTGLSLPRSTTILPLIRNQRIVDEHYGATELIEDTINFTQLYVIPLRLREVRPATMDAPEISIDTTIAPSNTSVYEQEEKILKTLKMYPEIDMETVKEAIQLIKECHGQNKRKSGEPFYSHPVAVAQILLNYTKDQDTVIAALLHDTVEDTSLSLAQIGGMFNEAVQHIVDGVTHLESNIKTQKRVSLSSHENIQKLLGVDDDRVLYVKLADRLHNMRTIEGHKQVSKQKKIAEETLQFFVPIARYLKLHPIEKELQQLAFQVMSKP
jgi:Na+/proline symporter